MARQLGRSGWKVGLTARRLEALESVAASVRASGGVASVAEADGTDPPALRAAIAKLIEQLGPVDLLIANAGVGLGMSAVDFSGDQFDQMVRVNLVGAAYAIEAVLPSMIERGRGQIVGISSLAAFRGLPGSCGYSATKAGLSTLLEGLRSELKPLGIAVTTVHPGYIRTPMTVNQTNFQPLLMDTDRAVAIILRGVARRQSRIDFPWRMATFLRFVRILPDWVYDPIAARLLLGRKSARIPIRSESGG